MIRVKVKEKKSLFKNKRDNYTGKFRKKELINYLRNELRTCTTHGIPYVVNTEIHWTERLYWAVSFLLCFIITILLLASQASRLLNKPIVMSVEKNYFDWNISFPAITVCPKRKVDIQSLVTLTEYPGLDIEEFLKLLEEVNFNSVGKMRKLQYSHYNNNMKTLQPRDIAKVSATVFKKFYEGYLLKGSDWPVSVDVAMTEMGLCHVLNSNVAVFDNPLNWKNSTIIYEKKSIELSIHDVDFFIQLMNYDTTFQIFIHSPDETVLSTSPSNKFSTEGHQLFGVNIVSTRTAETLRRTPIAFRKCRFINEPISERYPVYSYNHCLLECRIKIIYKLCRCIPHYYKPLDHERVCTLEEHKCLANNLKAITTLTESEGVSERNKGGSSQVNCNCITACESDVYLKDKEGFIPVTSINRVKVTLSSFPKVRFLRDVIISTYDIILRTGGVINLCVGASVASMFELLIIAIKALKLRKFK